MCNLSYEGEVPPDPLGGITVQRLNFQVSYYFGDLTMSALFVTFRKGSFFSSASYWDKLDEYLAINFPL